MTATPTPDPWPYDAVRGDPLTARRIPVVRGDPLTARRIPVVRNPHPAWRYEVALVITDQAPYAPALRPDPAEVEQVVAYLEYRMQHYRSGWRAQMRKAPLDLDDTTNTVILQKRGPGDWCYRRSTWTRGPLMAPDRTVEGPVALGQLLDRINDTNPDGWNRWKAAHPTAFPPAGEG